MLQENKNILKQGNENPCSIKNENPYSINIDAKCDSQNINKYIDTDPYSYISEWIIHISKNITNGRGLTQVGVNCLSLFLLTGGLLYAHTVFPQNIFGFLKLYLVPLSFFILFIMDLLNNITWVNNWFMKIFKKSEFEYCGIINDSVSLSELENYLQYKAFNSQQFISIVEHLKKKNQFSPKCQAKLMCNKALYEVESINYIKDSLLEFDFVTQSVCIFLKNMEMRLDPQYLEKLIERYGKSPSVLFSVGKYHKYKINESDSLYRLGYEFHYKRKPYDKLLTSIRIFGMTLGIVLLILLLMSLLLIIQGLIEAFSLILDQRFLIMFGLLFLSLIIACILNYLDEKQFEKSIRKYLQNKKDLDMNIIEDIIIDLNRVY